MTYEYQCVVCGEVIEVIKPVAEMDREELHCNTPMKRIISKPAIRFVGSGFYVNDYKK